MSNGEFVTPPESGSTPPSSTPNATPAQAGSAPWPWEPSPIDEPTMIDTPSSPAGAAQPPPATVAPEPAPANASPVELRLAAVQRVLARDSPANDEEPASQTSVPDAPVAPATEPDLAASPATEPEPTVPPPPEPADAHPAALPLGRMRKVPADLDWYADPAGLLGPLLENLGTLGQVVGIRLKIPEGGARLLDPGCTMVVDDRDTSSVVLVADRGASSDGSLGLLLRHMVSTESRTAVWISTDDRPEHVAIIRWLNDATAVRIYMVRIAAVEVNDHPVALVFVTAVRAPAR
jgi:hypothetical protein